MGPKETDRYEWVLVATEYCPIAVNEFGAKKSAHFRWVLIVMVYSHYTEQCLSLINFLIR